VGEDAESTLDTLVRMLWEIQSSRSGIQRLVDKLATVFVPPSSPSRSSRPARRSHFGAPPTEAALVGLTVLIVSCPCALGLATPLAVAAGIRDAARRGIVIVSDAVFEEAADVDTVVLDKTGTLTDGEMRLLDTETDGTDPETVRKRAAALERASIHPIAEAIVSGVRGEETERDGTTTQPAAATDGWHGGRRQHSNRWRYGGCGRAVARRRGCDCHGQGVSGRIDGDEVVVGHRRCSRAMRGACPSRSTRSARTLARRVASRRTLAGAGPSGVLVVGDEVRTAGRRLLRI